jgi:hypothetical protein
VREQVSELSAVRRLLDELQQDFSFRTGDELRIGKVFVQDPVKCVEQFFFRIHCATPGSNGHVLPSRIPRSMIGVDENLRLVAPGEWRYKSSMQSETHSCFDAIYR